jgi:hypothetical protein
LVACFCGIRELEKPSERCPILEQVKDPWFVAFVLLGKFGNPIFKWISIFKKISLFFLGKIKILWKNAVLKLTLNFAPMWQSITDKYLKVWAGVVILIRRISFSTERGEKTP